MMLIDMHSHSTISDGTLSVEQMVAEAELRGYDAYAVTDHAGGPNPCVAEIVPVVCREIERLQPHTPVQLFPGVELTGVEPASIALQAREARERGARVVVVHGECVTMQVLPGTNAGAVRSDEVDILAHPGLLSDEDAAEAARRGIFVEISARHGHSWANGHVFGAASAAGGQIVVDSDAHEAGGMLTLEKVEALLRGAGASARQSEYIRSHAATAFLARVERRPVGAR